jgi:hypothetical protein
VPTVVTRKWFEGVVRRQGGYRIRLRLRSTHDGGRETPLLGATEYRVNWRIVSRDPGKQTGGPTLIDAELLSPGEEGTATLTPFELTAWQCVGVGTELTAFEGAREVAEAVVTEVIPQREHAG